MLTATGFLTHIFTTPEKKNSEGESYGGDYKIQLLGDMYLENGEFKKELMTLKVHDVEPYKAFQGAEIRVPIGAMAMAKNSIIFYIPKGSVPESVAHKPASGGASK